MGQRRRYRDTFRPFKSTLCRCVTHPSCKHKNNFNITVFKTYLGPHKEQSAALEIPDVEETAGVPISSLDSWRFPNKSQCSFRSQLFAAPAARCGSLENALAEEFLVAWFRKAMHISGLFLIVMRLNNILSYTLVNNLSQEVELDRKGSIC